MSVVGPNLEDDLNFLAKWKTTSILMKMGDNFHFNVNGIRPKFFIFWKMEYDLNFKENGRRPQF